MDENNTNKNDDNNEVKEENLGTEQESEQTSENSEAPVTPEPAKEQSSNEDLQESLESQIEQASTGKIDTETDLEKKTTKDEEGNPPDLGTAKDQMNREEGIEIL